MIHVTRWASRAVLVAGAALVVSAVSLSSTYQPSSAASVWPAGFGDCAGPDCPPGAYPGVPSTGAFRDDNLSVFVGGDFTIADQAAEAEGRVVVIGDLAMSKSSSPSVYNIGEAIGSGVWPTAGSVALAVGGDVTVAPDQSLLVGASIELDAAVAGATTGTVTPTGGFVPAGPVLAPFEGAAAELTTLSECISAAVSASPTGTVAVDGSGTATLTSSNASADPQLFQIDAGVVADITGDILIDPAIDDSATIIIDVIDSSPGSSYSIGGYANGGAGDLLTFRERMLWNFAAIESVGILGPIVFPGSVLVGSDSSTTTVTSPSFNGRTYVVGDLVHGGAGGSGQEFHTYPYRGLLPSCSNPTTSPSGSGSPSGSASPSSSPSGSASPSSSPSSSPSGSASPSLSPTSTLSPDGPDDPALASTGLPLSELALLVGMGLLVFGAAAVGLTARREDLRKR